MGHVAAPEPTSVGWRGLELRNTWQCRSSTQQGGKAQGHRPRDSTGAHLSKEVRSRAAGHVTAPEPTSVGRCGPKLQLAWQRVDAHPAPCLDLELVCRVLSLQGADRGPRAHLGRGCERTGGANFSAPRLVILSFYSAADGKPREVLELEVWKLETSMVGPLGGAGGRSDSGHHRS
jgi:hypothetical protein